MSVFGIILRRSYERHWLPVPDTLIGIPPKYGFVFGMLRATLALGLVSGIMVFGNSFVTYVQYKSQLDDAAEIMARDRALIEQNGFDADLIAAKQSLLMRKRAVYTAEEETLAKLPMAQLIDRANLLDPTVALNPNRLST